MVLSMEKTFVKVRGVELEIKNIEEKGLKLTKWTKRCFLF